MASVEGETFTAEVLAQVEAVDVGGTIRCLSDTLDSKHRLVSAQGILRVDDQSLSRYRFRHILFQKHLYNSLDPVKRVYLHQAVGTALEMLYGGAIAGGRGCHAAIGAALSGSRGCGESGWLSASSGREGATAYTPTQEAVEYFQRALALLDGFHRTNCGGTGGRRWPAGSTRAWATYWSGPGSTTRPGWPIKGPWPCARG